MNSLDSYAGVLKLLKRAGTGQRSPLGEAELPFLDRLPGIERLFQTLSAVAPAKPGAPDEEWNPLSQRPHSPLPPPVSVELGAEITALKEAIDAFTSLCHEMLHVALWEPFFAGTWRPKNLTEFRDFALRGEGFCFFFSDIILTRAIRVQLPDGEFALDRQTPSSARFHPVRAFQALKIKDDDKILDIYLEGFHGAKTLLWKPKGTSDFAAALASQVYDFYAQSLGYLDAFYAALAAFDCFGEFFERYCAVPGLPTFWQRPFQPTKSYFADFFGAGITQLAALTESEASAIRGRRMVQIRAYFALQVRWLLRENLTVGRTSWSSPLRKKTLGHVEAYLGGLETALKKSSVKMLAPFDAAYETQVRKVFIQHDVWVGERALILPRRANGKISVFTKPRVKNRVDKAKTLVTVAYLVDELTRAMKASRTIEERTALLDQIQRVAALGKNATALPRELKRPLVLPTWSVPLASVDPVNNDYRELVFSYQ